MVIIIASRSVAKSRLPMQSPSKHRTSTETNRFGRREFWSVYRSLKILTASRRGQDNRGRHSSAAISHHRLSRDNVATCTDPGKIRMCNLWFQRLLTPYPLGHNATGSFACHRAQARTHSSPHGLNLE